MIEFCRNLAINIFWVLTAVFQVWLVLTLIMWIITKILKHLPGKKDEE